MGVCHWPLKIGPKNDLVDIGQGQRSLHATHPLMLMMICARYGKNASRIVQGGSRKIRIDLQLKTLQSRHDFQSQGQMTLKI